MCFLHNKEKTFYLFFFFHDTDENFLKTSFFQKGDENSIKKVTVLILLSFILNALLLSMLRTEHHFCLNPFSTSFSAFKTRLCH